MASKTRNSNRHSTIAEAESPQYNIQGNPSSKPSTKKRGRASSGDLPSKRSSVADSSSNRASTSNANSRRASAGDEPSQRTSTSDATFRKSKAPMPCTSPEKSESDVSFPLSPDPEMFGQDDPEENLSFVDEEDEEDIELPSGSVIPSTTSDSGVIGYIKNIKELKIGKGALDFFASENGFRGAVSKVRLKTSGRYVKHMGPSGKSFLVENHLNALLIGLFYLFATNFGLRNVMDALINLVTSADAIADVDEPMLTFSLVQMFIRDAGNPLQQEFLKEFNRVKDNFKIMIKSFCDEKYLVWKYPWVTAVSKEIDEKLKINMLHNFLKDVKERVESLLHYNETSAEKSSDAYLELKSVMKESRLRFVQCKRIKELTVKRPNTTIEDRCSLMPQCILEAFIVEIGIVADTDEFISAYSEALMLSIIYYRMIKFTRGDWVTKSHELALKIAEDIKKEREHILFKDLAMRDELDKQRKTAFMTFSLDRSATVRRALSENDSNPSRSVKPNKVAASANYREDAEGKLVRY